MVITAEHRVVFKSFEFDDVYFEVGEELRILINAESSDAYGCVFDTRHYDMHTLHYQGINYAAEEHGFWVEKSVIDEHTVPFLHNPTPDWEV